jgi:hypothetical protein
MKKQIIEEFLQQIAVFPLVEGEVVKTDYQGFEIKIVGLHLHAECPLSETTKGLQKGEAGLFYVLSCDKHGSAVVSYKRGAEFEAMYNLAVNETPVYAHASPVLKVLQELPFESVVMAFDGEGMLSDSIGFLPSWEITGFDDLPERGEKFELLLRGIDTHMSRPSAITTQKKSHEISLREPSEIGGIELHWLERYLILFKKRNFMMGYVGEQSKDGFLIEFNYGVTGLLPLDQLQTQDQLLFGQSIGVLIKDAFKNQLILTRKPLEVLNSEPWL